MNLIVTPFCMCYLYVFSFPLSTSAYIKKQLITKFQILIMIFRSF